MPQWIEPWEKLAGFDSCNQFFFLFDFFILGMANGAKVGLKLRLGINVPEIKVLSGCLFMVKIWASHIFS